MPTLNGYRRFSLPTKLRVNVILHDGARSPDSMEFAPGSFSIKPCNLIQSSDASDNGLRDCHQEGDAYRTRKHSIFWVANLSQQAFLFYCLPCGPQTPARWRHKSIGLFVIKQCRPYRVPDDLNDQGSSHQLW